MKRHPVGFTLIELLIVVAVITILAAIALPNFLEAQVRSKVSRAQSDMRSLATALDAYRVDNNRYRKAFLTEALPQRLKHLTSPIAYITSIPKDPFWKEDTSTFHGSSPLYVYASGNLYAGGAAVFDTVEAVGSLYSLASRGPDQDLDGGGYCVAHPIALRSGLSIRTTYDPTNGTISSGDIYRLSPGTLGDDL